MLSFQEDLLHYVWKLQYLNISGLKTTEGESLAILHPGFHNYNSGPDFSEGKIKIGSTEWVGNIEIHIKSSDWVKHKHYEDDAYDNVILHVVYDEDEIIVRENGSRIPCLVLNGIVKREIFTNYLRLKSEDNWIPCEKLVHEIDDFSKKLWMDKMLVSRLEDKTQYFIKLLENTNYNWEYCLFIVIGKYFGAKINTTAFEQLCKSVSLDIIYKNISDPFIIESLLYGQSGLLSSTLKDEYPQAMMKEYRHLRKKYDLKPISTKLWKFFRMRPGSFPTLRIAHFASLLANNGYNLFSRILEIKTIEDFHKLFDNEIGPYWQDHYRFDKESEKRSKHLGKDFVNIVLINAILPMIFLYGKLRQEEKYIEQALRFYKDTSPEKNKIISRWKELDFTTENAADTQALLQLKLQYCDKNRCLQCGIGHQIVNK